MDDKFTHEEYVEYWKGMMKAAGRLADTYPKIRYPTEVGVSEDYDGERTDCQSWEMDEQYIRDCIGMDKEQPSDKDIGDAEQYILNIIRNGPKCKYCIWNDGGPKSCTHPSVEDCKHHEVEVTVEWTRTMERTSRFKITDWDYGTIIEGEELTEPEEIDGSANNVTRVKCMKCNKEIPIDRIGSKFLEQFADEWFDLDNARKESDK